MAIEEDTTKVKEMVLSQIEASSLPPEQKKQLSNQIKAMTAEQLEDFLKKNREQAQQSGGDGGGGEGTEQKSECIFCSIINQKTQSYIIDSNKAAIAILDINPLTKGHSLVIPTKHESIEKLPSSVLSLAKRVAKKIKKKMKAEDVKIETNNIQGHGIVNIIPLYKDGKMDRKPAKKEELIELQSVLITKKRPSKAKKPRKKEKKLSELPTAPKRMP